MSSMNQV